MKKSPPANVELLVTLVRHGQAGHVELPGFVQAPLTPLGQRQARRVARRLRDVQYSHIYCSDFSRAHQTAQAIAKYHPHTPLTVVADIREVSIHHCRRGPRPRAAASRKQLAQEKARVTRFWKQLIRTHQGPAGGGGHVLVVAHGSLIGLLVATAAGLDPRYTVPLDTPNTSVTTIATRPEGYDLWRSPIRLVVALCANHLSAATRSQSGYQKYLPLAPGLPGLAGPVIVSKVKSF